MFFQNFSKYDKKIYLKLYFYAFIILVTTVILTAISNGIVFYFNQDNTFREHFKHEASFIQKNLKNISKEKPNELNNKIDEIYKELNWDISYYKNNNLVYFSGKKSDKPKQEIFDNLLKTKEIENLSRYKNKPDFIIFLDEKNISNGYLILKFNNIPYSHFLMAFSFSAFFILLFLGLMLIPYSLYVMKPFKEIITSIKKVSKGDFSTIIEIKNNTEFKELTDSFNIMILTIQKMVTEKQRLIADVSHELRSPLTRMRVGLEILSKDPEGRKKYIEKAILEIDQLNKMIEEILDISKLELDTKLNLEEVNFIEFVSENIENNSFLFENTKIKIKTDYPKEKILVKIDKNLMNRVLNNIFSNLVKYSALEEKAELKIYKEDNNLIFSLRDYGIGVNKEDLEKIFYPFYRTDNSRSRKTGGTGLGLSIVKKIIESHNGIVWGIIPDDNKGFCLNFSINYK